MSPPELEGYTENVPSRTQRIQRACPLQSTENIQRLFPLGRRGYTENVPLRTQDTQSTEVTQRMFPLEYSGLTKNVLS
jgi:hypothetical protein